MGASLGAVAIALVVALVVVAMVTISGGGLFHPLVTHEPALAAEAAPTPPVQS